ncbi:without maturity [Haematobia irritans]|uniref:without maturity n=1 Tax=Haematobia irritans TaxID=7368 RepID=UPI003F4FC6DD
MALNPLNKNIVKFSLLTVLLHFVTNGSAIKCFVCDSDDNPSCADLKSNSSIVAEECTLDKMKSIHTWLFEINRFSYFDTGSKKSPLMNCQKVVARNTTFNRLVTARFCQLNTGESDACNILRSKLRTESDNYRKMNYKSYKNSNGEQEVIPDQDSEFHCSICDSDNCNGAMGVRSITGLVSAACWLSLLFSGLRQQALYQRMW